MKRSSCFGIFVAVLAASSAAFVVAACDDDDVAPASIDAGRAETGSSPDAAPVCVDEPNCGHCATGFAFKPECNNRAACCANNVGGSGKTSAELANALQKCVCQDSCPAECAGSCQVLSAPTEACYACTRDKCAEVAFQCLMDTDPDPACNPDAGTGGGGDGGTDDAGPEAGTEG